MQEVKESPAMAYRGHIENGAVILDDPVEWPDGTKVVVEAMGPPPGRHHPEVERLIGILPENIDVRDAYRAYLLEKHK